MASRSDELFSRLSNEPEASKKVCRWTVQAVYLPERLYEALDHGKLLDA